MALVEARLCHLPPINMDLLGSIIDVEYHRAVRRLTTTNDQGTTAPHPGVNGALHATPVEPPHRVADLLRSLPPYPDDEAGLSPPDTPESRQQALEDLREACDQADVQVQLLDACYPRRVTLDPGERWGELLDSLRCQVREIARRLGCPTPDGRIEVRTDEDARCQVDVWRNWALARLEGLTGLPAALPPARHSDDFASVHWFGSDYTFSRTQAPCVRVLWENWERGTPDVHQSTILDAADPNNDRRSRLSDLFARYPAWNTMIVPGPIRGNFRLAPPPA